MLCRKPYHQDSIKSHCYHLASLQSKKKVEKLLGCEYTNIIIASVVAVA